jgi:hypothetical protein
VFTSPPPAALWTKLSYSTPETCWAHQRGNSDIDDNIVHSHPWMPSLHRNSASSLLLAAGKYVRQYIDSTVPAMAVGEFWDTCEYTDGVLNYNQDGHRQRTVSWCDQTGGTSAAFDFTLKGARACDQGARHSCRLSQATLQGLPPAQSPVTAMAGRTTVLCVTCRHPAGGDGAGGVLAAVRQPGAAARRPGHVALPLRHLHRQP